jgi:hypothetical protein
MKEFIFIFRREEPAGQTEQLSPEQMQAMTKQWQDWIGSIAAQDKLSNIGNRLGFEGKVVRQGKVVNGPYAELKETIGGFIVVKTGDIDEAVELSKGCPILVTGGSVEVRPVG